jgi:hypothetical protein
MLAGPLLHLHCVPTRIIYVLLAERTDYRWFRRKYFGSEF